MTSWGPASIRAGCVNETSTVTVFAVSFSNHLLAVFRMAVWLVMALVVLHLEDFFASVHCACETYMLCLLLGISFK